VREVSPPKAPIALFGALRRDPYPWLLESSLPSPALGRYSFAGADPWLVVRARGRRVELECRRPVWPGLATGRRAFEADPFELLRSLLPGRRPTGAQAPVPFAGGMVGYLGYGLARQLEALPPAACDDLGLPDLVLLFADRVLAWDHLSGRLLACGLGFGPNARSAEACAARAAGELLRRIAGAAQGPCDGSPAPPRPLRRHPKRGREPARPGRRPPGRFDAPAHAKAIAAVQREIDRGNVYQACLTHRLVREFAGDPFDLYLCLRRANPAPFASFLELPEVAIAGSSPERFLRLEPDGRVESRPIKGTRPRGRFPQEDAALRRELESSPKERAENLMIVDLVRNDLGRVCQIGSVEVPELMAIESYASVFQLVSSVRGRLRRDRDLVDLLRAAFPPGSMTGAPKIAAMQLLARLEPVERGIYSGALGYLDARGGADLSVVIRTLLVCGGRAFVHAGGGIVADSEPLAEWRESLVKARPLLAALAAADEVPARPRPAPGPDPAP
jgi:aminodeoxychorismate synthase component I